jgi:hypothetical protein
MEPIQLLIQVVLENQQARENPPQRVSALPQQIIASLHSPSQQQAPPSIRR